MIFVTSTQSGDAIIGSSDSLNKTCYNYHRKLWKAQHQNTKRGNQYEFLIFIIEYLSRRWISRT